MSRQPRIHRLDRDLSERVLQRAIDRQTRADADRDDFTLDHLKSIAGELGVDHHHVEQALREELSAEVGAPRESWWDRLLAPSEVSVGRVIDLPENAIDERIQHWMLDHVGAASERRDGATFKWRRASRGRPRDPLAQVEEFGTRTTWVGESEHIVELEANTSRFPAETGATTAVAAVLAVILATAFGSWIPFALVLVGCALFIRSRARRHVHDVRGGLETGLETIRTHDPASCTNATLSDLMTWASRVAHDVMSETAKPPGGLRLTPELSEWLAIGMAEPPEAEDTSRRLGEASAD